MKSKLLSTPSMQKLAIAALVLGIAAWKFGSHSVAMEQTSTLNRPALTVRTTTLQDEQWGHSLSANGSIVPWQEAVIGAQIQGLRISEVKVSIGDRVQEGDVLVTLDNYVRPAGDQSGRTAQGRVVAPDSGIISAANANVGSMAQPGVELFRLIRKGRLEWRAELTADELMLLRRGMPVVVTVGEGRILKGSVRAISPSVDTKTRYGYALVSLNDSSGIIAGAYARGTFDISDGKRALSSLSQTAVMRRGSDAYVLVVDADSRVYERPVILGQQSGDRIEIRQGLKPDEKVVETGGPFLSEGDVVQVLK